MTSSQRRPFIAGNWKMNTTRSEAVALAGALSEPLGALQQIDSAVCPPLVWLTAVGQVLAGSAVGLGAQNCHFESKGAFTGEVAPTMLVDVGCSYVIVGHSERRTLFGETDALVARKVRAAHGNGLTPILCVGENLAQREGGETEQIVGVQVSAALNGLSAEQVAQLVIAYEPIWAIGTGRAATAEQANETIGQIRGCVRDLVGDTAAGSVRIQYGGSVKPTNAEELLAAPDVDGALVGGASLEADDFARIVRAAE
jgi:triosephosphate isomerase